MKIIFICSSRKGKGISPFISEQLESLKNEGLFVNYFIVTGKGIFNYLKNISLMKDELKKNHYDIIHAHYGFSGIISFFARKKEKLLVSFMGGDVLGLVDFKGRTKLISKILAHFNVLFARFFFDYNIVKSKKMFDVIKRDRKTSIIPNGVDFKKFYPIEKQEARNQLNLPSNLKYILFSSDPGRPEKNYILFEKSVQLLNHSNIKVNALKGFSRQEVLLHVNAADVLVMTSFFEGSPNVIKEALACNCPIVSTDVGDVSLLLNDIRNCYICKNNPIEIASKIEEILGSNERSNGREKIEHLRIDHIAQQIKSVYFNLISE